MSSMSPNQYPLVSIVCVVKNGIESIKRAIDSILAQDYPNIEIIVQDGASTDGTLEILQEYGDKVKLVSEPDSNGAEAFSRVLSRINGDFFGSCLADEEMLPHAVSWGVKNLQNNPDLAAVYGDCYKTDIEGNIKSVRGGHDFDMTKLICVEIVPPFLCAFFKTSYFRQIQLSYPPENNIDYEIWVKLGMKFQIMQSEEIVMKSSNHANSSSCQSKTYLLHVQSKKRIMDSVFNDPTTPDWIKSLRFRAYSGLYFWASSSLIGNYNKGYDTTEQALAYAKEYYLEALKYEPDKKTLEMVARKLFKIGTMFYQKVELEKALEYVELPLKSGLCFAGVNQSCAVVLEALGRLDQARDAAEAELKIQPGNQEAINLLQQLDNDDKFLGANKVNTMNRTSGSKQQMFQSWIDTVSMTKERIYYRDQTVQSLTFLTELVRKYDPTKIIELGTGAGMSLRGWISATTNTDIAAVDRNFNSLHDSKDIIPLDLARVKLIEGNILQTNFASLWDANDRVLFFVDAHDLEDAPIMNYVLENVANSLPKGSLIVVDDLWYSSETITDGNVQEVSQWITSDETDPLRAFKGHYAPYWEGGAFVGFKEVVPLMEWVNRNRVHLHFERKGKAVAFECNKNTANDSTNNFNIDVFSKMTGEFHYNPLNQVRVLDSGSASLQAKALCEQSVKFFDIHKARNSLKCLEQAMSLSKNIRHISYAMAVCQARLGQFDIALKGLQFEINSAHPHPNAQKIFADINGYLNRDKKDEVQPLINNDENLGYADQDFVEKTLENARHALPCKPQVVSNSSSDENCTSTESLTKYILSENPQLEKYLSQKKIIDAAIILREWVSRFASLSVEKLMLSYEDPVSIFNAITNEKGGVWCGAISRFYASTLRLFGIPAALCSYAVKEVRGLSHVTTLFCDTTKAHMPIYQIDAYMNYHYADASTGMMLEFFELIRRIHAKEYSGIALVETPVKRKLLTLPCDTKEYKWFNSGREELKLSHKKADVWVYKYASPMLLRWIPIELPDQVDDILSGRSVEQYMLDMMLCNTKFSSTPDDTLDGLCKKKMLLAEQGTLIQDGPTTGSHELLVYNSQSLANEKYNAEDSDVPDKEFESFLGGLRDKWREVPSTQLGRSYSTDMLEWSDDRLMEHWEQCRTQVNDPTMRQWSKYSGDFSGLEIADVGPGMGFDGIYLSKRGAHITFVDIIEDNLKLLKRICDLKGVDADYYYIDDLFEFHFKRKFDVFVAMGSLHHTPFRHMKRQVKAMMRYLKVNGRMFMLTYPKERYIDCGAKDFAEFGRKTDGDRTPWAEWYDDEKIKALLGPDFRLNWSTNFGEVSTNFNWFDLTKVSESDSSLQAPSYKTSDLSKQSLGAASESVDKEPVPKSMNDVVKLPEMAPPELHGCTAGSKQQMFQSWIDTMSMTKKRIYYRDQTVRSFTFLTELVRKHDPTKIIELGTSSGMSLRGWISATTDAEIVAVDLSFDQLHKSKESIPLDLSRVKLIEGDILQVDFAPLWDANDKVLFFVDAHDLDDVPIMNYVLENVVKLLPVGSIVVVDDLWYSSETIAGNKNAKVFERITSEEVDPLQILEAYHAPYWQGGAFVGFKEVVPLMEWVNRNRIELKFDPKGKTVMFHCGQDITKDPAVDFSIDAFNKMTGNFHYNPLNQVTVFDSGPASQQAKALCQQSVKFFDINQIQDSLKCLEQAMSLSKNIRYVSYAMAVCQARMRQYDMALKGLQFEINSAHPHPKAQKLFVDINGYLNRHREDEVQALPADTNEPHEADQKYLSVVVTSRNDDHGGNTLHRTQVFAKGFAQQCKRFGLDAELIFVEWNPPADRKRLYEVLDLPDDLGPLTVRFIEVPPEIHYSIGNSDKFPLFQMTAKNVGIRRAKGKFVVATNIDVLFNDELIQYLASEQLDENSCYRIDRHDTYNKTIPTDIDISGQLEFCKNSLVRVQGLYRTEKISDMQTDHFIYDPGDTKIHDNACGDFTLMAKEKWFSFRAYPELPLWSFHIDGLLLHMSRVAKMPQVILPEPMRIYHIEHETGWKVISETVKERPSLNCGKDYEPWCQRMIDEGQPITNNDENWGYADQDFVEKTLGNARHALTEIEKDALVIVVDMHDKILSENAAALQGWREYYEKNMGNLCSVLEYCNDNNIKTQEALYFGTRNTELDHIRFDYTLNDEVDYSQFSHIYFCGISLDLCVVAKTKGYFGIEHPQKTLLENCSLQGLKYVGPIDYCVTGQVCKEIGKFEKMNQLHTFVNDFIRANKIDAMDWTAKKNEKYLTVVATSRNDDHGGDTLRRTQIFVNALFAQCKRHRVNAELVLVEWNPPADRPGLADVLSWPADNNYCNARVITVPSETHNQYKHAASLPLYQMMAKNVGIRRAKGQFVLSTNIDILFSNELFKFFASDSMKKGRMYRVNRLDVDNKVPDDGSLDEQLAFCEANIIRVNSMYGTKNLVTGDYHAVMSPGKEYEWAKLNTNACGDFQLMHRDHWSDLRGYPELDMYSFLLDSIFEYMANFGGATEETLPDSMRIYHIEHGAGWTPESNKAGTLWNRLEQGNVERMTNQQREVYTKKMTAEKKPIIFNGQNWGHHGTEFKEQVIRSNKQKAMKQPGNVKEKYLSIIVTSRNDDHGGNALHRTQMFVNGLAEQCKRYDLHAELIFVEWNPPGNKKRLYEVLDFPDKLGPLDVRFIEVPKELHDRIGNSDKLPLFQMIAKNVGIRRARGKFVLATNIDVLFSNELIQFLASKQLDENNYYRIDRYDVASRIIPTLGSVDEQLKFCDKNLVRVVGLHKTKSISVIGSDHFEYTSKDQRPHTNGCGDFTLMSKNKWEQLRGYPELEMYSIYIDGLLIMMACVSGMRQTILQSPMRVYHIEHDMGWVVMVTNDKDKEKPVIDYHKEFIPWCNKMFKTGQVINPNKENWGFIENKFKETLIDDIHQRPMKYTSPHKVYFQEYEANPFLRGLPQGSKINSKPEKLEEIFRSAHEIENKFSSKAVLFIGSESYDAATVTAVQGLNNLGFSIYTLKKPNINSFFCNKVIDSTEGLKFDFVLSNLHWGTRWSYYKKYDLNSYFKVLIDGDDNKGDHNWEQKYRLYCTKYQIDPPQHVKDAEYAPCRWVEPLDGYKPDLVFTSQKIIGDKSTYYLPFGIQDEYKVFCQGKSTSQKDIDFVHIPGPGADRDHMKKLLEVSVKDGSIVGNIFNEQVRGEMIVPEMIKDLYTKEVNDKVIQGYFRYGFCKEYYEVLNRSKVLIYPGVNKGTWWESKRPWESFASGCMMMTTKPGIDESDYPFTELCPEAVYTDDCDLIEKLNYLYNHPKLFDDLRKSAVERAWKYFSSDAIGRYFLDKVHLHMTGIREVTDTAAGDITIGAQDDKTVLSGDKTELFQLWIDKFSEKENRLYFRDQSARSLNILSNIVDEYKPTKIVELGTLSGMSLRTWIAAATDAEITAVDLSFVHLEKSKEIAPLDLSRVTLVEQDILKTDFTKFWSARDRVIFYVDAHDLVGVPIIDHVLNNAVPSLPDGSIVMVDDMWYCPDEITAQSVTKFFDKVTTYYVDSLQSFEGCFAPYWKGGFFMGFREVIPLLEWVNRHKVELEFVHGDKAAMFRCNSRDAKSIDEHFDIASFNYRTGIMNYNPVGDVKVVNNGSQQAQDLCQQGIDLYSKGQTLKSLECFRAAVGVTQNIYSILYAQGLCMAKMGEFELAMQLLELELKQKMPHPRTNIMLDDIGRHLNQEQVTEPIEQKKKGLTIFTIPKAFKGYTNVIQRNAIKSWMKLSPSPEIILFGNDKGTKEIAEEFGLTHIPDVNCNEFGTPQIDHLFNMAQQSASNDIIAYVNADIILFNDFIDAAGSVEDKSEKFLMVGQRWDVGITEHVNFDDNQWSRRLLDRVKLEGQQHGPTGIDYFVFKKDLWPTILPFAIGRTAWDNWLVAEALRQGAAVVDATDDVTVVHQEHDYAHLSGGKDEVWNGPEAKKNLAMAGGHESIRWISHLSIALVDGELVSNVVRQNQKGNACFDRGDIKGSIDAFDRITKIEPGNIIAHNNLGIAYQQDSDMSHALKSFAKAYQLDPHNRLTVFNIYRLYMQMGSQSDADKLLSKYLEARPDDTAILQEIAILKETVTGNKKGRRKITSTSRVAPLPVVKVE